MYETMKTNDKSPNIIDVKSQIHKQKPFSWKIELALARAF